MKREEILDFCSKWLPAWHGDRPNDLIEFYSDNALYIDPANKKGLKGRDQVFPYFKKLLAANPDWKWEPVEVFPTDIGFVAKWKATMPVGREVITEYGMDIVEIERGKIMRNEVYFDRSSFLEALRKLKSETV
jgi:ketosteroid isomerase-like protein